MQNFSHAKIRHAKARGYVGTQVTLGAQFSRSTLSVICSYIEMLFMYLLFMSVHGLLQYRSPWSVFRLRFIVLYTLDGTLASQHKSLGTYASVIVC